MKKQTQLADILAQKDLKKQIEAFIEKEVQKRLNDQFNEKVNLEVSKQIEQFKKKQNETIQQEVQKILAKERQKINGSPERLSIDQKKSPSKRNLLVGSMDATNPIPGSAGGASAPYNSSPSKNISEAK